MHQVLNLELPPVCTANLLDHFLAAGGGHGDTEAFNPQAGHVEVVQAGQGVLGVHDHFPGQGFGHHKSQTGFPVVDIADGGEGGGYVRGLNLR